MTDFEDKLRAAIGSTNARKNAANQTEAALREKTAKAPIAGGVLQLFPRAMHLLAALSKQGADKYGTTVATIQFLETPGAYQMHTDAMVRHVVDEGLEGPVNYKDGGVLHPTQAAWNALARLEIFLNDAEKVEKPPTICQNVCQKLYCNDPNCHRSWADDAEKPVPDLLAVRYIHTHDPWILGCLCPSCENIRWPDEAAP